MNTIFLAIAAIALFSDTFIHTNKNHKPAQGGTCSVMISQDGQDVLKIDGVGRLGAKSGKGIYLTFAGKEGNVFSLSIFGSSSGDYKFEVPPEGIKEDNLPEGHALFILISSPSGQKFAKGMLFSTSGILHVTVANGTCSGQFEGVASVWANGAFGTIKYKLTGAFKNVPLKTVKKE